MDYQLTRWFPISSQVSWPCKSQSCGATSHPYSHYITANLRQQTPRHLGTKVKFTGVFSTNDTLPKVCKNLHTIIAQNVHQPNEESEECLVCAEKYNTENIQKGREAEHQIRYKDACQTYRTRKLQVKHAKRCKIKL